jgi:hypothetical protein
MTPSQAAAAPSADLQQRKDGRFYLIMAIVSTGLVFSGFARSFYFNSYFGTPRLTPLVQLHGIIFSSWMVFFVVQTAPIASNRPVLHRRLGYAGGILASVMVVIGLWVAFTAERLGHRNPLADAETVFLISLVDILTFAAIVGAGLWWRRNREFHQRLMLLSVVAGLLSAAIPRLPIIGGHPAGMGITGLALLFAGPIYDFIVRRRVHPAYFWGCLSL